MKEMAGKLNKRMVLMLAIAVFVGSIFGSAVTTVMIAKGVARKDIIRIWQTSNSSWTDGVITATLEDETLVFSGDGAIEATSVWLKLAPVDKHQVRKIIIGEGIKSIGDFEFSGGLLGYPNLEEVVINANLSKIGRCAFWENENLKEITVNGSLGDVSSDAFEECISLKTPPNP